MGNVVQDLERRLAERDAVLQRLIKQLTDDERVSAAWLYGSLGRNTGDALSDIDVRVVVVDAQCEALCAERQAYAAQLGPLWLVQEAPHNAPPGGAFLLVMYPGSVGPIQVDWTWQPQSRAIIPADVRVLFDRVGLPAATPAASASGSSLADGLTERSVFFWMMVQVAAKTIARQQAWAAIPILSHAYDALTSVKSLLNEPDRSPLPKRWGSEPVPAHPIAQLALVRSLADDMATLTAQMVGFGAQVPAAVIAPAYRFFELVEAMLGQPPTKHHL